MHVFETPALFNKLDRQPVQQFRVSRESARFAKVAERFYDALAKVMFPDSIDRHARRQGMVGLRQPSGQCESPPCRFCTWPWRFNVEWSLAVSQHRWDTGADEASWAHRISAAVDVCQRWIAAIPQRLNLWFGLALRFKCLDLGIGSFRTGCLLCGSNLPSDAFVVLLPCLSLDRRNRSENSAAGNVLTDWPDSWMNLRSEPVVLVVRTFKNIDDAVVVSVRNRVEFVTMASGTLQCQSQDAGSKHVDLVSDDVNSVRNETE